MWYSAVGFFVTLALSLLAAPLATVAQQPPGKTTRIGFLGDVPPFLDDAFRRGLRELGYVEGQNITIEHRAPDWQYERLPALVAELVRLQVDVIVAASPPAAAAAKQATSTIPIVVPSQATRWPRASSPAWLGPAVTSLDLPPLAQS